MTGLPGATAPEPMPVPPESHGHRRHRRHRRRRRQALAVVAVLTVAVAVLGAVLAVTRYLPALDAARAVKTDADAVMSRLKTAGLGIGQADVDALNAELDDARRNLATVDDLLAHDPLVALARALPPTRDAVTGADDVAAAGDQLLAAADHATALANRFVAIKAQQAASAQGASSLAELVALMATSGSDVTAIGQSADLARALLAAAPAGLPSQIGDVRDQLLAKIDQYRPALATFAQLQGTLPDMLGWSAPRRYLVLTQDPAELRPTGGFIGSFGVIAFDKGRITERHFQDVFLLDLPWSYPFVTPPAPLERYLLGPKQPWQLADANWSPDFPTSAQQAVALYKNEGGTGSIDGVLAITTQTIDQLLAVTGPVTVPDYGVTIASGETTLKVLQNTRRPQPGSAANRKAFLSDFADTLFTTLFAMPPSKWLDLAGRGDAIRNGRLLQAWSSDPAAEAEIGQLGFDGAVRAVGGDYLYPVDSNVAPASKLSAVTTRSLDLTVTLDAYGNAADDLGVTWQNEIETPAAAPYRALPDVGQLREMGMYFRLLVPERSRIQKVSGGTLQALTAPSDVGDEAGRTVFANYLRIPPGPAHLRYNWISPYASDLGQDGVFTYYLTIQKQPGLLPGPVSLTINLPRGATVLDQSAGMALRGLTLTATATLDRDLTVAVRYRLPGTTP